LKIFSVSRNSARQWIHKSVASRCAGCQTPGNRPHVRRNDGTRWLILGRFENLARICARIFYWWHWPTVQL